MKITNFEQVTKELQQNLEAYLNGNGILTKKNFSCLNPSHSDSKPSMSLVRPDGIRVYCHGCGAHGDIFDVCAWIEKKPLTGQGFMTETLPYLAKKFDIEIEHTELTEDEQYQLDTYRAYRHAYEFITSWDDNSIPVDVATELDRRKWSDHKFLKQMGVGFVNDYNAFRNHLKNLGFSASFLDDVDLGRKEIFSPQHLIFTIKDEVGRPVGFAARNLVVGDDKPKYVNQKTTGVKCNIYQKGKRLYGFDTAIKHKNEGPLYIMEGYSDVLSCQINGFNRAIATCGTALTDDHLILLKEYGVYNVVLCYDNDKPGQERTESILDNKFSNHKDISVSVLTVSAGKDPDELIREQGIDSFVSLEPISAFKWRLFRFDETVEADQICKTMIPLIATEPSAISQEKMIKELALFTGYTVKTLQLELNRILSEKERGKEKERRVILERMNKDLLAKPEESEIIISEAQSKLYNLKVRYDEDIMSEEATLRFLQDIKTIEETRKEDDYGFYLGEDLREYQKAVLGDWKDTLQVFGGKANSGKTSFLVKLGYQIASHEKNNAIVIYHTIDDSAEQLLPKWICVAEGSAQLEINQVKNPNYWKNDNEFNNLAARREIGYQKIMNLVREGRLVIKDTNQGASLSYAEYLIKYYQEKYPDRKIVYILDNFHKLRDFEGLGDERTRYKTMSQVLKNMAVKYHIAVLCTMEYTKLAAGVKPSNDNIAESVQMEYDANLIAHLWNGMHELGERATPDMHHTVMTGEGVERRPVVEMNIGKNKITSFKNKVYFKFFPASSDFREQPLDVIEASKPAANEKRTNTISLFAKG